MLDKEGVKKSVALNKQLQTHLAAIGIPVCRRLDFGWLMGFFSRNFQNTKDNDIIEARRITKEICVLKGIDKWL